jgi:DNA-binding IclR family transcriptional regulator
MQEPDRQPQLASAAAHAMAVLEAFTPVFPELGVAELAQRTGLPPEVAHDIAFTLCQGGHLQYDEQRRRYRLGPSLIGLARNFLGTRGVRAHARGHMDALANRLRSPIALSEREGLDMLYLEYIRGDAPVVVQHRVGTRLPIAKSAAGRAWLACASKPEAAWVRERLAADLRREWEQLQPRLDAAGEDLATFGFTRSYGELQSEVNAVAVPLRSPVDGMLMVFSLAAPSMLAPAKRFDSELGPALKSMVAAVKADLETAGSGSLPA